MNALSARLAAVESRVNTEPIRTFREPGRTMPTLFGAHRRSKINARLRQPPIDWWSRRSACRPTTSSSPWFPFRTRTSPLGVAYCSLPTTCHAGERADRGYVGFAPIPLPTRPYASSLIGHRTVEFRAFGTRTGWLNGLPASLPALLCLQYRLVQKYEANQVVSLMLLHSS
jgi:hypothetical protein